MPSLVPPHRPLHSLLKIWRVVQSNCCDWSDPIGQKVRTSPTAKEYCEKLTCESGADNAEADAEKCTATTCCQMVTEQDTRPGPGQFLQVTRCKTRIGNTAQCKGSCKAKVRPTDTQLTLN